MRCRETSYDGKKISVSSNPSAFHNLVDYAPETSYIGTDTEHVHGTSLTNHITKKYYISKTTREITWFLKMYKADPTGTADP